MFVVPPLRGRPHTLKKSKLSGNLSPTPSVFLSRTTPTGGKSMPVTTDDAQSTTHNSVRPLFHDLPNASPQFDDMLATLDLSKEEVESLLQSEKFHTHRALRTRLLAQQLQIIAQDHAHHALQKLLDLTNSHRPAVARLAATQILALAHLLPTQHPTPPAAPASPPAPAPQSSPGIAIPRPASAAQQSATPSARCAFIAFLRNLKMKPRHLLASALCCLSPCLLLPTRAAAPAPAAPATQPAIPPAQILQDLQAFASTGSVLMIAAHPDDENTQLLTYLARGRHYRTAYMSLTRGDGGQNLLGPEFGQELGLIRTEELLAARRLDSAQQFFSRALDFGFSKRADETLKTWDQNAITADIVRVIRTFRPDVIITRFNPDIPGGVGTHGHHTASAILARNAFNLLQKDPNAFPDQLTPEGGNLKPWQPKRILMNMGGPGGGGGNGGGVRIDISGTDPVRNIPYTQIANESRAQHKSQGFGQGPGGGGGRGGGPGGGGPRYESFTLLAGEPATTDIMDNIDTSLGRIAPEFAASTLLSDLILKFDQKNPAAIVPALLDIRATLAKLPPDPLLTIKREQLDHLLAECLGLTVQTTISSPQVIPGQSIQLTCSASFSANLPANLPIKWLTVRIPGKEGADRPPADPVRITNAIELHSNQPASQPLTAQLPATTPVSQPYWLRQESLPGLFRVAEADQPLIGRPENPPVLPIQYVFQVGEETLFIADEPVQKNSTAQARRLEVLAPVSLAFPFDVALFAPGSSHKVTVEVTAHKPNAAGTVTLNAPSNWSVDDSSGSKFKNNSGSEHFTLAAVGDHASFAFTVTAPNQPAGDTLTASVSVDGQGYATGYKTIDYPHIPHLTLQPPAHLHALALDLKVSAKNIAYLPGAGDSVAECIEQMGCKVTQITGKDLSPENLKQFDAVVLGVRALNVRTDLPSMQPLFDYANAGGTVIVQYNRPDAIKVPQIGPFELRLSSNRVTDENAAMTFLAPAHKALTSPNPITAKDFENWVQERGIYYPATWGKEFTPILAASDPGEEPLPGALLIADMGPEGKGHFVYTSLVFFRELPAPNPGAYRLFANLLSLGKN